MQSQLFQIGTLPVFLILILWKVKNFNFLFSITLGIIEPKLSIHWKVNEKLDTELREFKNYIFQSLLETCNQDLNASFLYCNRSQCI